MIPAFARLLETATPELDDEILEVIGEMCLYNNAAYFSELLDLILKQDKYSLKSVSNLLVQ